MIEVTVRNWMDPMQVYLLHNEPQAERTLAPIVIQLEGVIHRAESVREVIDESRTQTDARCLITSVLPGMECAMEFVPQLRRKLPDLPIIIWSANLDVPTGVELMRRGAFSVLEYPCSEPTLLLTLHQAVHESQRLRVRTHRESDLRGKLGKLSDGEREVMRLLFDGLTNKEIAARLTVSRRTIEARRQRIVKVTGVANLIRLVVLLAEHGLLDSSRDTAGPPRGTDPIAEIPYLRARSIEA